MTPATNTVSITLRVDSGRHWISRMKRDAQRTCSYWQTPANKRCWRCGKAHHGQNFEGNKCNVCRSLSRGPYVMRRGCFNNGIDSSIGKARCLPLPLPPPKLKVCDEMIAEFMSDIEAVCQKHGLGFDHEDTQGAFLIVEWEDDQLCGDNTENNTGD